MKKLLKEILHVINRIFFTQKPALSLRKDMQLQNDVFIPMVIELCRKQGKNGTIPLKGFSMNPWLVGGRDYASISVDILDIKKNDVVLAEIQPGSYALHRVTNVDGDKIQMRGDGNLSFDPIITRKEIRAVATGFFRNGNKTMTSVNDPHYLLYVRFWNSLTPFRRILLALYRHLIMPPVYRNFK